MINIDNITKENIIEHNPNWPQIRDHPYRLLIIGVSGSGKMNPLINSKKSATRYWWNIFIC